MAFADGRLCFTIMRYFYMSLSLFCACSAQSKSENAQDSASDIIHTTDSITDGTFIDQADGPLSLRRCPTSGKGAVEGDFCFLLTPFESGLPMGENATVDQFALRPIANNRGKLLVFFNGSGGSPLAGTRGSSTQNFYQTARQAGLHVFAVSYRSNDAIGSLCKGDDGCFLPTRRTILRGEFENGAPSALASIAPHEGAIARIAAGLETLAKLDPEGKWETFLQPGNNVFERIQWPKVMASGHSQGGGHAAVLGLTFSLDRVIALSSPCDMTSSGPANWLQASKTNYATNPSLAFYGLGASGDQICSGFESIWTSLMMASSRKSVGAVVCTGSTAHGATIECPENASKWLKMME